MKKTSWLLFAVGLLFSGVSENAMAIPISTSITVNATHGNGCDQNSIGGCWGGPYNPLDTGIDIDQGEILTISVDPSDTWNFGWGQPSAETNAEGVFLSEFQYNGFSANVGTLVGLIGSTYYDFGTYSSSQVEAGRLFLMFWDSCYVDNVGSVLTNISVRSTGVSNAPVPEPATMLLFGSGLAGLAGMARRRMRMAA